MATLYVNATGGDDTRSYATAQNSGTPWATIGRAAWGDETRSTPNASEAAQAGDTVIVAAGTYNYSGTLSNRFAVLYNPANSGTLGNPIIFQANGTVTLTAAALEAPVIGANAKNYIEWDGFTLREPDVLGTPDTGPVVFTGATGGAIRNCVLDGIQVAYNDNHPGVRIENSTGVTVRLNDISGFRKTPDAGNGVAVQMYGAADCLIERNNFTDCGAGVAFKDTGSTNTQQNNVVRYNLFTGCNEALIYSEVTGGSTEDRNYVYQNLFIGCDFGIFLTGATNDYIMNNTFVGGLVGIYVNGLTNKTGVKVHGNIFSGYTTAIQVNGTGMEPATDVSLEHNVYYGYTTFFDHDGADLTYASFNSTYTDQHVASPAPSTADPLFLNAAVNDYHLGASSPARNLVIDVLDLDGDSSTVDTISAGAYVTGNESIGVDLSLDVPVAGGHPVLLLVVM